MESNLKGRSVILEVTEFQGEKRIDHTLKVAPNVQIKKNADGSEIMEVEALITPEGMGGGAPVITDLSNEGRQYSFLLKFDTNESFGFVNNLSLKLIKSETFDGAAPKKTTLLDYKITPIQGEFEFSDLIPLPRIIDTEVVLGEKELKVGYRFTRHELDASVSKELQTIGVPVTLDLPSMKVAAGLLGAQLHLPFKDVEQDKDVPVVVTGTDLFQVAPQAKLPIKFSHDLAPTFDFGSGTGAPATDNVGKYVLTLEFNTDESFSKISDVKLVLTHITKGEGEAAAPTREEVVKYDLEEVNFQLPIYPGDDR
jgi:hypothetical protein